jgi:hypothetical protein
MVQSEFLSHKASGSGAKAALGDSALGGAMAGAGSALGVALDSGNVAFVGAPPQAAIRSNAAIPNSFSFMVYEDS